MASKVINPEELMNYPPYTITKTILNLVGEISEMLGRFQASGRTSPKLRRINRLRSIQASLAIENNTLTLEEVTAVVQGKRVLAPPREIQEVKGAFAAYELMDKWNPANLKDLLTAHGVLMAGLMDNPGKLRTRRRVQGGADGSHGAACLPGAKASTKGPGLASKS